MTPFVGLMVRLDQQTLRLGNSCWSTASEGLTEALEGLNSGEKLSPLPEGVWEEPEVWFGNWLSRGQRKALKTSWEVPVVDLITFNVESEGLILI